MKILINAIIGACLGMALAAVMIAFVTLMLWDIVPELYTWTYIRIGIISGVVVSFIHPPVALRGIKND